MDPLRLMSLFQLLLEHLSELVLNLSLRLQLRSLLQSHGLELELKIYDSTHEHLAVKSLTIVTGIGNPSYKPSVRTVDKAQMKNAL